MGRSQISENQALDGDFASEAELTTVSGHLHHRIKGRYVTDDPPSNLDLLVWQSFSDEWGFFSASAIITGLPYYYYDSDENEESTNSTSWINRFTLTVSGIEPGKHRIAWYYEYRLNKAGKDLYVRVYLNDDTANPIHDVYLSMIQTTNYVSTSGFYHETLSSGTYHIDMDWSISSAQGGTTAYMRRVRLEFWRVGD